MGFGRPVEPGAVSMICQGEGGGAGCGRTAGVDDEDIVGRLNRGIEAAGEVRVGVGLNGEVVRGSLGNLRRANPRNRIFRRDRNTLKLRVIEKEARARRYEQVVHSLLRYPCRQEQDGVSQLRQRKDGDKIVEVRRAQDRDHFGLLSRRDPRGDVGLVDARDSVGEDVELLHCVVDVLDAGGGVRHDDMVRVGACSPAHQLVDGLDGAVVLGGRRGREGLCDAVRHGLCAEALGRSRGDGGFCGHGGRRAGHVSGGQFTEEALDGHIYGRRPGGETRTARDVYTVIFGIARMADIPAAAPRGFVPRQRLFRAWGACVVGGGLGKAPWQPHKPTVIGRKEIRLLVRRRKRIRWLWRLRGTSGDPQNQDSGWHSRSPVRLLWSWSLT